MISEEGNEKTLSKRIQELQTDTITIKLVIILCITVISKRIVKDPSNARVFG